MNYIRGAFSAASQYYTSLPPINPSTLTGAIDVIVLERQSEEHPDETELACSPFHVRFGKFQAFRPGDRKVNVLVNGETIPFNMKIGEAGEAFFVIETEDDVPPELLTSPLLEATKVEPDTYSFPSASPPSQSNGFSSGSPDHSQPSTSLESDSHLREFERGFGVEASGSGSTIKASGSGKGESASGPPTRSQSLLTSTAPSRVSTATTMATPPRSPPTRAATDPKSTSTQSDATSAEETNGAGTTTPESYVSKHDSSPLFSALHHWRKSVDKVGRIEMPAASVSQPVLTHSRGSSWTSLDMSKPSTPTPTSPPLTASRPSSPPPPPGRHYIKTLRLTSDQLKQLNLKKGANTITFSLSASGAVACTARIFLWESSDLLVVSDIDGTITKSDALGHVFTMIGRDWTHVGVAKLYTDIARNGYNIMYLTSRAIGQADSTRDYLKGINQNNYQLPEGPVIMSPDRLMTSLHREVIMKKPEVFKMACLRDIQRLYGKNATGHFYAGFGNRITDALSYRSVNIPSSRIFTIDSSGEVKMELLELAGYKSSYIHMTDLVDQMFPPVHRNVTAEFTDFNYWRPPM
ncbi:LNS2-domain-containing protein, partial [Clavulina sp. PMI_390]